MKTLHLYFILFFLIIGCINNQKNASQADKDYALYHQIQNCINVIALVQEGHTIPFKDLSNSYQCLEILTGVDSHVLLSSDSPFFYGYSDKGEYFLFYDDVRKWQSWYLANRENVNLKMANMKLQEYATSEEIEISWPSSYLDLLVKERTLGSY